MQERKELEGGREGEEGARGREGGREGRRFPQINHMQLLCSHHIDPGSI